MGWRLMESPKTVRATSELVTEFAEMTPAPNDRPIRQARLSIYGDIYDRGEFRSVTWASCLCREDYVTYRVNGKHTSKMLQGLPDFREFYVTIERYDCDTLIDVAKLYATFDSGIGTRSSRDIVSAFVGSIDDLRDLNRKVPQLVITAASYAKWGRQLYGHPPAERSELLLANQGFADWLNDLLYGPNSSAEQARPLQRSAVVSAMLPTFELASTDSSRFWQLVRDETAEARDDPTRALARFLRSVSAATGGPLGGYGGGRLSSGIGFNEMYAKCIHAWNAWRRGGELAHLRYHPKAPLPKAA